MSAEHNTWPHLGEKGEIARDESYYLFPEPSLIQGYRMFSTNLQ